MREKKSIGEFMRVIMLAVLCILLAMLGLRLCKDWLEDLKIRWENQGITLAGKSSSAAGEIVEFVWNRRQQTMGAEGQGQKKKETVSLTGFMELLNPWNSYEREEKALPPAEKDRDPAYKNFLASREFYIEHQYLLEYGDEESGQESILADSESGAGTMGSEGFENRTETPPQIQGQNPAGDSQAVSGTVYSMAQLADYDFLMKTFYNTHTSTTAGRDMMSAEKMLGTDLSIKKDGASPQILIYHSHSQEAFADSGQNQTIVEVGDYLTELLEAKGFGVIHDRSVYDLVDGKLDRSRAYTYALEGITKILQENPDIQVVLDIHRDGVGENVRLTSQVNGKPTAQIMFFNGLSRTPEGPIEYLPNPYLDENLAFSFQMQLKAAALYPGYARKIYLKGLRYNLHLRPRSALVEVGAQTNTFEEVRNAMEPLAEILAAVLNGE